MKDLLAVKSQILEDYNNIVAEKKVNAPKLNLRSSASSSSKNLKKLEESNKSGFKISNLETENIFKMSLEEITTQVQDLHQALFKCSNVNFANNKQDQEDYNE